MIIVPSKAKMILFGTQYILVMNELIQSTENSYKHLDPSFVLSHLRCVRFG